MIWMSFSSEGVPVIYRYIVNHRTRFRLLRFSNINISQGSVAMHLRSGGIFYYRFTIFPAKYVG